MNIVQAGANYQVFGEDVQTYKELPAKTYTVKFHPMRGFWLEEHIDLATNEEQIYGRHAQRVNKIFGSYDLASRNFGVILSGAKGIGKSLLARMIADRAIQSNLPVILVDTAIPGIAHFLSSIQQRCVIIFDEFEKTFHQLKDEADPQVEMLSLFDGIDGGKKLFIITCNDPRELNEFLINRPGRFHYHFEIACPTADEVRAYLSDKLVNGFDAEIEKVVKLASIADITYDCLRAIAFDLSQGYPLEDTLADLNINYERNARFDVIVRLSNGIEMISYSNAVDLYGKQTASIRFRSNERDDFWFTFNPKDIESRDGVLTIDGDKCKFITDYDTFDGGGRSDEEAEQMRKEFNENVKVINATFTKVVYSAVNKYI